MGKTRPLPFAVAAACALVLILAGCRREDTPQVVKRPPGVARSSVAFRLVVPRPEAGDIELRGPDGELLILAAAPVAIERDITRVEVIKSLEPPHYAILLYFTPEAARALAETSRDNINRKMAVVLDGKKVLAAPRITSVFSSPVMIQGPFSKEEATRIGETLAP